MLVCWTWSCLPNTRHKRNALPALQRSPNTTRYHSHSYCFECSQSNLRASLARHMMPLRLIRCIRRKASGRGWHFQSCLCSFVVDVAPWVAGGQCRGKEKQCSHVEDGYSCVHIIKYKCEPAWYAFQDWDGCRHMLTHTHTHTETHFFLTRRVTWNRILFSEHEMGQWMSHGPPILSSLHSWWQTVCVCVCVCVHICVTEWESIVAVGQNGYSVVSTCRLT